MESRGPVSVVKITVDGQRGRREERVRLADFLEGMKEEVAGAEDKVVGEHSKEAREADKHTTCREETEDSILSDKGYKVVVEEDEASVEVCERPTKAGVRECSRMEVVSRKESSRMEVVCRVFWVSMRLAQAILSFLLPASLIVLRLI